jgi:hypothetical protein
LSRLMFEPETAARAASLSSVGGAIANHIYPQI